MPIPNLLHPVPVKIQQIDKANTFYDEDAREPVQHAARKATVTLPGQAKWGAQFDMSPGKGGISEDAAGYVLFRRVDLGAAGISLQVNDRISQIGDVDTDVYIMKLEWTGHYLSAGGPTLVKAYFADRQPARQTRG